MGYDVHITRKALWCDETGPALTLDEWLAYVAADPEMRADGYAEVQTGDGEALRTDDPGMAVWTAYSQHGVGSNMAWIWHFEDCVTAKNPDRELRQKMYRIAVALGARVQGEEGEEYGADGEALSGDEAAPVKDVPVKPASARRAWWRFWEN